MEKQKKIIRAIKAAKAPITIAAICKKTRLTSADVSEVLNHLSTLGRLEMECDPIIGNWSNSRGGHEWIEIRYSLKEGA